MSDTNDQSRATREGIEIDSPDPAILSREAGLVLFTAASNGDMIEAVGWAAYTGQLERDARGTGWLDAIHPEDRAKVASTWADAVVTGTAWEAYCRVRRRDGTFRDMLVRAAPVHRSTAPGLSWLGFGVDIADRPPGGFTPDARDRLRDTLTALPNRAVFEDRLQQAVLLSRRQGSPFALLIVDLDEFGQVNRAYGQERGDILLQQVAIRLRRTVRESDTVARIGGDSFAVLLPGSDEVGATLAARKILVAMDATFDMSGIAVDLGATVGIALCPQHGHESQSLLHHAWAAMYSARRSEGGFAEYGFGKNQQEVHRIALGRELRSAIDGGALTLLYQPVVELRTGRVDCVEAIVAWDHPRHGYTSSDDLLELVDLSGLSHAFTAWLLASVTRQCSAWREAGLDIQVTINLPNRSLQDPRLVDRIAELLRHHVIPPHALTLEVPEAAVAGAPDRVLRALDRLHHMGTHLSLDDVGAGHASLALLRRLPLTQMKIHRTFVAQLVASEDDALIVQAFIGAGHTFGLTVGAEGVDAAAAWELLRELGCDIAQGYYAGQPLEAVDVPRRALSLDVGGL